MDITTQISSLIEIIKKQPNSVARNKTLSHLQDARVWSKELDDKFAGLDNSTQTPTEQARGCTCTEIGVSRNCPIHAS